MLELSQSAAEALLFRARRSLSRSLDDARASGGFSISATPCLAPASPVQRSRQDRRGRRLLRNGRRRRTGSRASGHASPRAAAGRRPGSHDRTDLGTGGARRVQRPRPATVSVSSAVGRKGATGTSTATPSPVSPTATAAASDGDRPELPLLGTPPSQTPQRELRTSQARSVRRLISVGRPSRAGERRCDRRRGECQPRQLDRGGLCRRRRNEGDVSPSAGASADVAGTSIESTLPTGDRSASPRRARHRASRKREPEVSQRPLVLLSSVQTSCAMAWNAVAAGER